MMRRRSLEDGWQQGEASESSQHANDDIDLIQPANGGSADSQPGNGAGAHVDLIQPANEAPPLPFGSGRLEGKSAEAVNQAEQRGAPTAAPSGGPQRKGASHESPRRSPPDFLITAAAQSGMLQGVLSRSANREERTQKPKLAVWKFSSCDGCQLSLLDCEDELLAVAGEVEIANFPEASRAVVKGPYDLSLVEGSITTPHDEERIHHVRRVSKYLVTIGACATAGGIQALRNFKDVKQFISIVYATPKYIETLSKSTPITDHVFVDFELRGCPINKHQLVEVISAFLHGRKPNTPPHSVCVECKQRGTVCVMVAQGIPCLGPVTHAGCGALCPAYNRGCYGCFGPKETPNTMSLSTHCEALGMQRQDIVRVFRTFNAYAEAFRKESEAHEQ